MVYFVNIEPTITIPLSEYQTLLKLVPLVAKLEARIESLEEEKQQLKNGRSSKTSSTPPSQDYGRNYQKSLRPPTSRKPGGQEGHEGNTLKMVANPDQIKEYRPEFCQSCGEKLDSAKAKLVSKKQEIDIPPIIPTYIEHQSYSCGCQNCGHLTTSALPQNLRANIQYGPQVNALVGYLSIRQYIPYARIAEAMNDIFNIPLSQGTIDNMLGNMCKNALPMHEEIRLRTEQSKVVGGDETGVKINGKKGWIFTFQTKVLTFLTVSFSRGFDSINSVFKNGFPFGVYITDCWAAQLKTKAKVHQICLAHLERELNNFIETFKCHWAVQLKELFHQALNLKKQLEPWEYPENNRVKGLEIMLAQQLKTELSDKNKKVQAFIKRLNKNQDAIFTFLKYPEVPPDNNASERAIRNAKVKMKISNQFKSWEGAQRFTVLRSVVDTAIKNSQNVLNVFSSLANLPAE